MTIFSITLSALTLAAVAYLLFRSFGGKSEGLERLESAFSKLEGAQASFGTQLREEMRNSRTESAEGLARLSAANDARLEAIRAAVDEKLQSIQKENAKKLDEMRATVDEKLHTTLEKRLGEAFSSVGKSLEAVQQGLGEMKTLAADVGSLQKVLSNVKQRGVWGEMFLENLLRDVLTPAQYEKNFKPRPESGEVVEFAVKLPGGGDGPVWLPVDSKFSKEDYERLLAAQERSDPAAAEAAGKALETRLKSQAKDIHDKYIHPPRTTDFAILYLPVESLYAEVLCRPGLAEELQAKYRVNVAGPTTFAALLNSLQMGFRTLAIEQRAGEVRDLLGAVKAEFHKFGDILDKTHKQLQTASRSIQEATTKTRTIEKKLRGVEQLPGERAQELLDSDEESAEETAA